MALKTTDYDASLVSPQLREIKVPTSSEAKQVGKRFTQLSESISGRRESFLQVIKANHLKKK